MPGIVIDKRSLVASIPVFSDLGPEELDALLGLAITRSLDAREILFRKGDEGSELFGILAGRLRATTPSAHGKELTFSVMGAGEVFGEIALFDGKPRSATVEAVEPSRVIAIHRSDFNSFVERHPGLALRLLGVLAARVRRVSGIVEDMLFMNVPSRLAKRLLALARLFGHQNDHGTRIDMKLSAQDLGDLIGASGESVQKQLSLWQTQAVISQRGGEITILRPDLLGSLADIAAL